MLEQGDLITLNNGQEYIVVNQITSEGKNYIYLITKDGLSDVKICLFEGDTLTIVKDAELIEKLIEKFKEKQGR